MPLDIQGGGAADKIRRFLGVRGRLPLRLDEQVIPVVNVGQADEPPFRQDAWEVMCYGDQAASAGNFGWTGIQLPLTTPGALRVWGTTLINTVAADSYSLFLGNSVDYGAIASAPVIQTINVENYPAPVAAALVPFQPWTALHGVKATMGQGSRLSLHRMPVDASFYQPLKITLRPGWVLAWWRGTANAAVNASFLATYFPTGDVSVS